MSRRRDLPRVPGGYFGVPDPDTGRMTLWQGVGGDLKDFPRDGSTRWRPMPPAFPDLPREQREAARREWYEDVYWPWRREVAAAVCRDPATARSAFFQHVDQVPADTGEQETMPRPRRRPAPPPSAGELLRTEQEMLAAALRSAGRSVREIAAMLACSKSTADRRAAADVDVSPRIRARAAILQDLAALEGPIRSLPDDADRQNALVVIERIRAVLIDGSAWS